MTCTWLFLGEQAPCCKLVMRQAAHLLPTWGALLMRGGNHSSQAREWLPDSPPHSLGLGNKERESGQAHSVQA